MLKQHVIDNGYADVIDLSEMSAVFSSYSLQEQM